MHINNLNTTGEHHFTIHNSTRKIELCVTIPKAPLPNYVAIIGHPHSLQGGTMNNKVVTTLARVFDALSIPCIRFNFRGVGQSTGQFDAGIGESQDMQYLLQQYLHIHHATHVILAGFSFGSYVAYRTAAIIKPALLITIAPPVNHFDYTEFNLDHTPWLIVQGDEDEIVPANLVFDFAKNNNIALPVMQFGATGHFFHGKLTMLKAQLTAAITPYVR